ncbi:MAG: hypothetical protein KC713_03485 [Candidatus Omnitrophica bacterium]|nr:hypothetical protein [Candidatus Omnitrophota bacterium]
MKRIGIVASRISKGNLALYNIYVVLISFLFSSFIFIIAGATVVFALAILRYVSNEIMLSDFSQQWNNILYLSMISLAVVIGIFTVIAITKNIKIRIRK